MLSTETPEALRNKVFFDVTFHFGRRGREGWKDVKKDSFVFKTDDEGAEYATIRYNEKTKKNNGLDKHRTEKDQRMYATGDSNCPVASLKLYLQKLDDKSDYFLQGISPKAGKWYNGRKMGINNVNDFMKKISNEAKLSHVYTNHSIRATAATVLANNGIELNDILAITGHKDTKSLLPYTEKVSDAKRRKMSSILHDHAGTASTQNNSSTVVPDATSSVQITASHHEESTAAQTNVFQQEWNQATNGMFNSATFHATTMTFQIIKHWLKR